MIGASRGCRSHPPRYDRTEANSGAGRNAWEQNEKRAMRILLQNARNKLYFRRTDVWTSNPHAAFDFQHSERALDFITKQSLQNVQLVVKFADPQWDEVVPLPPAAAAS
jgi:hypothetical protein